MPAAQYLVIVVIAAAVVLVVRFEVLCIRDLYATDDVRLRYLTRTGWLMVILFSVPLGGIWYLVSGKRR